MQTVHNKEHWSTGYSSLDPIFSITTITGFDDMWLHQRLSFCCNDRFPPGGRKRSLVLGDHAISIKDGDFGLGISDPNQSFRFPHTCIDNVARPSSARMARLKTSVARLMRTTRTVCSF